MQVYRLGKSNTTIYGKILYWQEAYIDLILRSGSAQITISYATLLYLPQ